MVVRREVLSYVLGSLANIQHEQSTVVRAEVGIGKENAFLASDTEVCLVDGKPQITLPSVLKLQHVGVPAAHRFLKTRFYVAVFLNLQLLIYACFGIHKVSVRKK